jgi:hypothetical protein
VARVWNYLNTLPYHVFNNRAPETYYLLDNCTLSSTPVGDGAVVLTRALARIRGDHRNRGLLLGLGHVRAGRVGVA